VSDLSHGGDARAHGGGATADDGRRLATVLAISSTILVVGAVVSGSLALLADAGHMLTDAAGLVIALIAAAMAARPATDHRTWGYQRAEVLADAAGGGAARGRRVRARRGHPPAG